MSLAKAVCGGVAGGALLTTKEIAPSLRPGMHAATFGGNPIAAAAGVATMQMVEEEGLLEHAQNMAELFRQKLNDLAETCEIIREVRVLGMMIGLELECDGTPFVQKCLERKLLINCTQGNVIRLLPAMNITPELAEEGCAVLAEVLQGGAD